MLQRGWKTLVVLAIFGAGYGFGQLHEQVTSVAEAQDTDTAPPEATVARIREANDAVKIAMEALKSDSRYVSATKSMNTFAVFAGGINAIDDLEAGRGVDPVTFAGLYADDAIEEVAEHLGRDEEGRVTYKNKVVRLYPISRLKSTYAQRMVILGEADPTSGQ